MAGEMAARNCLLCGKPLSRIWAGTGEDFCSREHRNQYRLRCGMDRLLEANKVANVMRRREVPMQIPAADLRAPGPAEPRGFFGALRRPPAEVSIRPPRLAGKPHILPAVRYMKPRAIAAAPASRRDLPDPRRFGGPAARAPRVASRMPAHVIAAPPARLRPRPGAPARRRDVPIRWLGAGRPVVERLLARGARRQVTPMPAQPPRGISRPSRGRALRVSTAAGFRIPDAKPPAVPYAAPPQRLPETRPRRMTAAVRPPSASPIALAVESAPPAMRLPDAPGAAFERRFRWPGAFETRLPFRNAANEMRVTAVPFGPPDESAPKERK
jgi:hypothetical protein